MRLISWLAVLVAASMLVTPACAGAAVLVGFTEDYVAPDGSMCVHHGIDLTLPPDSPVLAPVSGTVRFAGRTPGPHGGSIQVVSLETDMGVVTMLPFSDISVEQGARLSAGEAVGTLASAGDPSSSAVHLHVGLKRGDVYLDPEPLVAFWSTRPTSECVETSRIPQSEPPVTCAAAGASPVPQPLYEAPLHPSPTADALPEGSAAVQDVAPTTVPEPGVSLSPRGAGTGVVATKTAVQSPAVTVETPASKAAPVPATVPATLSPPRSASPLAWALGSALSLIGGFALARRAFGSGLERGGVSDRFGTLLQHLKAGDTLCGLTSCSGPLPSQSRSH